MQLIIRLFKKHNERKRILFLQLLLSKENHVLFRWCCPYTYSLFGFCQKQYTPNVQQAAETIQSLLDETKPHSRLISLLQKQSRFLYGSLMDRSLSKAMSMVSDIYLKNDTSLPFGLFFDGKKYCFEKVRITNHRRYFPPYMVRKQQSRVRGIALVMPHAFDVHMEQEFDALSKLLKFQKKIPFHSYRMVPHQNDLIDIFESARWVHFIGHGVVIHDQFHFRLTPDNNLGVDTLMKTARHAPKALVMSCCQSLHRSLRYWFFTSGGKTLIGAKGNIVSSEMATIYRSFYWQVHTRRCAPIEAFHSIQKKSLKQGEISAFQLDLFGNGRLSLDSSLASLSFS